MTDSKEQGATPRADAVIIKRDATNYDFKRDMIALARTLERELTAAQIQIQELKADQEHVAGLEAEVLELRGRVTELELERNQHKEMHEYFQKDALELSNEIEAMTGLSADKKRYWFDRAWGAFMKMPDDFRSKLSVHQVRELFRIMFVTRPANSPDAPVVASMEGKTP